MATYDAPVSMTFEGRRYDGYEQALRTVPLDQLNPIGVGTQVHGPIDDTTVFELTSADPRKIVLMRAQPGLPYEFVLFVNHAARLQIGSEPFARSLPELCPFLTLPVLRQGCSPSDPVASPERVGAIYFRRTT